ncbi:MAG: tRNA (adenosine(37)-N6)-dimethylallyltransferase MiaA [Tetrasphaera sp.]|nr:tRNA (adenosine(37)-N6)-dimethylallyltransferase MiaA [Tetrasphaera sp.]
MPSAHPVVAVVGATATGKSALALDLAERIGGEIVNADAMQLYRGMDIGTAKLPVGERRGIAHHQLDILDVTDEASVAVYQRESRRDLDGISERGGIPLLVGGSGLYVRAALDALDIPPTDPDVRARWEAYAAAHGAEAAHSELARVDPLAAQQILPTNVRRIVRALEVNELTGGPFLAALPRRTYRRATVMVGLHLERDRLDERIGRRTEQMWADGLIDEVERLVAAGLREGRTARAAIGYQQALAQLDGNLREDEAIAETITATRRLVRRQESWFRPDPRIHWMPADDPGLTDAVLRLLDSAAT